MSGRAAESTNDDRVMADHGMNKQVITTPSGERLVVVPEAEFDRLRNAAEMASDIAAYDAAKRRLESGDDELVPLAIVERLLAGESPVRVWREHRGLTTKALADKAEVAPPYLSQIESGKRAGTVETLQRVARALDVTIDDLVAASDEPLPKSANARKAPSRSPASGRSSGRPPRAGR